MATGNPKTGRAQLAGHNPKMVRINIYITSQQESKLEELRSESGLPVAELLRRALDFYVPFAHKLGVSKVDE